jgi:hypothetical protein
MNKNNILFSFSFLLLIYSCQSNYVKEFEFQIVNPNNSNKVNILTQKLYGEKVDLSHDIFSAGKIKIFNNFLYVWTEEKDMHLSKFSLDGEFLESLISKGSGPGEILYLVNFTFNNLDGNEVFFGGDLTQNKIVTLRGGELIDVKFIDRLSNFLPLTDNHVLGVTLQSDKMFGIYDYSGNRIKSFGEFPANTISDVPFILSQAFVGTYGYNEERDIFVSALKYTDHLRIFSDVFKKDKVIEVRGPLYYDPIFSVTQSNGRSMFTQDIKGRFSFIDMVLTKDNIICLFSGYSREELPSKANNGDKIFIFDYKGNIVKGFVIEEKLFSIAYDESTNTLYGLDIISTDQENIFKYLLDQ